MCRVTLLTERGIPGTMEWVSEILAGLHQSGLWRDLHAAGSRPGPEMVIDGHKVLQFASNDYLCLAGDPRLAEAVSCAANTTGVGAAASRLVLGTGREVAELERRIGEVEAQLEGLARQSPLVRRLRSIPGVGLLSATAIVASIGNFTRFPSARHFASALGLTPRESSSGNVRRLGRITKRGDPYLRTLLIHGARSVLHHAKRNPKPDRLRAWALEREQARGHNKAAVAVANKLARIVWAVAARDVDYRGETAT